MATNPPYVVSSDDNEVAQKQIKSSKQIVKEEKSKRKQTKDLQKQIDVLQNQSNNERKVKDLKKKISDLENRKPNFSSLSGLNFPKRSVSSGNDRNYSPKSFCLGFGVCIVLLLIIFFAKKVFNSLN